jgi:hypothetical protein
MQGVLGDDFHPRIGGITNWGNCPDSSLRYHLVMTNIAMERSTMLLIGKASISMGYTMAMLVITRGYIYHKTLLLEMLEL